MQLQFTIYRQEDKGELAWGWKLVDKNMPNEQIAKSATYDTKDDNLAKLKLLIAMAKDGKIEPIKKEDISDRKLDDNCFYLVIGQDNNWAIQKGNLEIAEGLSKLELGNSANSLLEALPKVGPIAWEDPDDDENHKSKEDDPTIPNISGS